MADSKSTKRKAASEKDDAQKQDQRQEAQEAQDESSHRAAAPLTPDSGGQGEQPAEQAAQEQQKAAQDAADNPQPEQQSEEAQTPQREEAPDPERTVQGEAPDQSEPIQHRANRPASAAAPLEAPEQKKAGQEAFVPPQVTNAASGLAQDGGEKAQIVRADNGEAPDTEDLFTEVGADGMVAVKHRLIQHAFAQPYDRKITRLLLAEGSRVIPAHRDRLVAQIKQQQEGAEADGQAEESDGEKDENDR